MKRRTFVASGAAALAASAIPSTAADDNLDIGGVSEILLSVGPNVLVTTFEHRYVPYSPVENPEVVYMAPVENPGVFYMFHVSSHPWVSGKRPRNKTCLYVFVPDGQGFIATRSQIEEKLSEGRWRYETSSDQNMTYPKPRGPIAWCVGGDKLHPQ